MCEHAICNGRHRSTGRHFATDLFTRSRPPDLRLRWRIAYVPNAIWEVVFASVQCRMEVMFHSEVANEQVEPQLEWRLRLEG